ncbi:MAG: aminodeoxychorismate/anthranilate synthase component II [Crocinitomicaceae bacterium]|nr:aminodeoxychorismate/anthranilate synthase component II [Crocinitomicaceae bacterium]
MKVLIIDNYDSFTYNLVHYVEQFVDQVKVIRNDEPFQEELKIHDKLILSPGPGLPEDSGNLMDIIKTAIGNIPVLGVCLGHQALGLHFGAKLANLEHVHHGKQSKLHFIGEIDPIYEGIPNESNIGHYHSWVIEKTSLPNSIEVTATSLGEEIMSIKHKDLPVWGVQFHPESILTEHGLKMIANWINIDQNGC